MPGQLVGVGTRVRCKDTGVFGTVLDVAPDNILVGYGDYAPSEIINSSGSVSAFEKFSSRYDIIEAEHPSPQKRKLPRVLIVVEGGCVQSVISDIQLEYVIKDFDSLKDGRETDETIQLGVCLSDPVSEAEFDEAVAEDLDDCDAEPPSPDMWGIPI